MPENTPTHSATVTTSSSDTEIEIHPATWPELFAAQVAHRRDAIALSP